jgi:hypothetical protein
MAKRDYTKISIAAYKHELCVFFLSMTALFLFFALYSYNPHDSSWFYYFVRRPTLPMVWCIRSAWCGIIILFI